MSVARLTPVPVLLAFAVCAAAAGLLAASPSAAQTQAPPPAVLDALRAMVRSAKINGVLIVPDLAVTHAHGFPNAAQTGYETRVAFPALVDPVTRLVRPEHERLARILCHSPFIAADYIVWQMLEPPPEGVQPLKTSDNLNAIRWVGNARAYYTGRNAKEPGVSYEYPEVRVPGKAVIPGWSGTPALTDSGEVVGLVSRGGGPDLELTYITRSSWWTCHKRR